MLLKHKMRKTNEFFGILQIDVKYCTY